MIRVAIVDDNKHDAMLLYKYVGEYCKNHDIEYRAEMYANGLDFILRKIEIIYIHS